MRSLLARSSLPAVFVLLAVACSTGSTTTTGDGGMMEGGSDGSSGSSGSSVPPAIARVIVSAKLVKGTRTAAECPDDGKTLTIGSFAPPNAIENGGVQGASPVSVTCTVARSGPAFSAAASVTMGNPGGGALVVSGSPGASGAATDASVRLTIGDRTYASVACALAVNEAKGQAIAAGRYWTSFTCLGGKADETHVCDIEGELRIENCAQQ